MSALRSFLKQEPTPVILVCEYAESDDKRVKMGESRSRVRDAELACRGAIRVEAHDADGNVLRVWEAEDAAQQEGVVAVQTAVQPGGVGMSDMVAMMSTVARLIVEASDSAATRHAEAYQLAYNQQALLVNVMSERLSQLEHAWQESLMVRAEELDDSAAANPETPPPDPNTQLVTTLLQGAVMQQMANASNAGKS